ncbi:MAG TPA: TonB-dependent receptor [Flavobacteriales bacterium]|nr:TonB-dependent receptor [Flavobacteriales bacterium]
MNRNNIYSFLIMLALLLTSSNIFAQITLRGKVSDKSNKESLIGSNVVVKGTTKGTTTDIDGNFELEVDSLPVTLVATFVGYGKKEKKVESQGVDIDFDMEVAVFAGQEVVVSASRVSETIMESAISIQKMNAKEIRESASGDFYQGLGDLQGVDVTSASMGFKVISTRGFNTTSPIRSVQLIDGMDNQAPGLNFPVGNLLGASELDLEKVELISGAASALYGPSAMQGVISMSTKSPYVYKGLSAMVKGGSQDLLVGQFRYANTLDKKDKLALKITFAHQQATDWTADDSVANRYGDIEVEDLNLSSIVTQAQFDETLTQEERDDYVALNNYLGLVSPGAVPGKIDIQAPGYMEEDLADYGTRSTKIGAGLYYKLYDSLELSYEYKYGNGTAIYQGTNRYSINSIRFHQHKLELKGKNFFLRGYTTIENAGDSYDIVFTGINISKANISDYVSEYLSSYFDSIGGLKLYSNGFNDEVSEEKVTQAHSYAKANAEQQWYAVGSSKFDSTRKAILNNANLQKGSKFVDASSLQHVEAQYNFDMISFADIIAGANFRRYDPNSYGTIFEDTLVNVGDTLADGQPDIKAEFVDIEVMEYGGYVQLSKRILKDRLKLSGSIRVDKSQNYDAQLSPRLSAVYTYNNHNFRISGQSAFRPPTLQNQYLLIDLGPIILNGNLNGSGNLSKDGSAVPFYTLESAQDFKAMYDSTDANGNYIGSIQPQLLETIEIDPIKPERLTLFEVGYKGIIGKGLYMDVMAYYSIYKNFIGDIRVALPDGSAVAGEESGQDAIMTGAMQPYQIPTNAKQSVISYGASAGFNYYFGKGLMAKFNYTYAVLDTSGLTDDIIPGFNTPRNKLNIGLVGTRIWREFGFAINYKWVEKFRWESKFGDGDIPSYNLLDIQLNYHFTDLFSTLRIGASNLLENKHIEAYGAPKVGRIFYVSWAFHFDDF